MKKVLLLNQTFYPDKAATAQVLTDLALVLVENGYQVDVLCDARSWDDRSILYPLYENYKGINIQRVPSSAFGKKSMLHRGFDYLSFYLSLLSRLFRMGRYDHIISLTSPPLISFFGALFKAYRSSNLILWTMDVNPDEAVELGWLKRDGMVHRIMERLSKYRYKKTDRIICLDHYMASRISSKGSYDGKVSILPPWSLDDDIDHIPHEKNIFRKMHKLDNKFIVMYSGNFSVCHPVETLLETACQMKDDRKIVFLFIGAGVKKKEIEDFKNKHALDNILLMPYQDRNDLKHSLSAANLHVVIMGERYVGIIHPCKIYGILSTGRPFVLIGPERSHVGDIIHESGCGFRVDHGDVEGLKSVIRQAMELPEKEKAAIRARSQALVRQRYSRKILTKRFISTFLKS